MTHRTTLSDSVSSLRPAWALVLLLFAGAFASSASAAPAAITFEVEQVPFDQEVVNDAAPGFPDLAAPVVAYQHFRVQEKIVAPPGAGVIWAEDVHLTTGGLLRSLLIGYFMNLGIDGARATVWVYEGDPEDTLVPSKLLLGPIEFGLIGSNDVYTRQRMNFNIDPVMVGKDLWIAVTFNHNNPGLVVVSGDAQVGDTHDIFFDMSTGRTGRFKEPLRANFVAEVRVDPVPTAVKVLTWSKVKALFTGDSRPSASR